MRRAVSQLSHWLFGGSAISTKVALFPLEEYQSQIVTDLFGEDGYFCGRGPVLGAPEHRHRGQARGFLAKGWARSSSWKPVSTFRIGSIRRPRRSTAARSMSLFAAGRGRVPRRLSQHQGSAPKGEERKQAKPTARRPRPVARNSPPFFFTSICTGTGPSGSPCCTIPGAALRLMVADPIGGLRPLDREGGAAPGQVPRDRRQPRGERHLGRGLRRPPRGNALPSGDRKRSSDDGVQQVRSPPDLHDLRLPAEAVGRGCAAGSGASHGRDFGSQ